MKTGIKCEIHDCTLNAAGVLLNLSPDLMKEIGKAKKQRIDMQYYADRIVTEKDYAENINSSPNFVIEMEKIASNLTSSDIEQLREKFVRLTAGSPENQPDRE